MTETGPISPNPTGHQKHNIAKFNYLPRVIGYALFGIIYTSVLLDRPGEKSYLLWIGLGIQSTLWPHVAYLWGTKSSDIKRAELVNYNIDAFLGGIWIVLVSFSLWPASAIIIGGLSNNLATGGIQLVVKKLPYLGLGILLSALVGEGIEFVPETNIWTALSSIAFILIYVTLVSHLNYKNSKLLSESKKKLKTAHLELHSKYNITKENLIMQKKVEKDLLTANEKLEKFTYVVSHDLKAPIRGMFSLVHFLEKDLQESLNEQSKENFTLLKERLVRLETLVEGILKFSKTEKTSAILEMLDVKKALMQVIGDLSVPDKFKVLIETDFPHMIFSQIHLIEIYANLISNSIKYTGVEDGVIKLGYSSKEGFHEFYIEDNGIGIPVKFHSRVFEMFQRLHSGDEIEGSGIGLSIVSKILDSYGGKIWIDEKVINGTKIYFHIPKELDH